MWVVLARVVLTRYLARGIPFSVARVRKLNSYSTGGIRADVVRCYHSGTPTTVILKEHRHRYAIIWHQNSSWCGRSQSLTGQPLAVEGIIGVIWGALKHTTTDRLKVGSCYRRGSQTNHCPVCGSFATIHGNRVSVDPSPAVDHSNF